MLHRCTLILGLLLISMYGFSQTDTTYIKSFKKGFNIKASIDQKMTFFDINSEKDDDKYEYTVKTNRSPSISFGVTLRDYSLSFSKSIDFLLPNVPNKTKTFDFEYHGYKRKFIYDFFLQHHTGFEMDAEKGGKPNFHTSLQTRFYGGNFYYIFNHNKFSYRAIFSQNEKQIKPSGSLLLGASLFYNIIKSDSVFIANEISSNQKNLQFGLSAGYAYTWVFKYIQMSGSAIVGANIGNNYPENMFKYKLQFYPSINARFGAVYNKDEDKSFGLNVVFNSNYLYFRDDYDISFNNVQIMFSFVKRFDWGNKFVNKNIDRINSVKKKIGF